MNDLVPLPPRHDEVVGMPLAERVALEKDLETVRDLFEEAYDDIRRLNDEEIVRLVDAGLSLRELAEIAGLSKTRIVQRLDRLGVETQGQQVYTPVHPLPQNGDGPVEEVSGQVVDEGPVHFFPDVVAPDAENNLRTQTMHWISQGKHLEELMEEGAVIEPRDRGDKAALKREASHMAAIARRLKGAF